MRTRTSTRVTAWLTLGLLACALAATAAEAAPPKGGRDELLERARASVKAEQYCAARDYYYALHVRDRDAKFVYNAAESAYAADDRVSALALYQELLSSAPDFERAPNARRRVTDLGKLIAQSGIGSPCPPRVPKCSDFIVDSGEQCDDGNLASADGCDSNCTITTCGNGIVTSPERCDDGNLDDDDGCDSQCRSVVYTEVEEPDPEPDPESEPEPEVMYEPAAVVQLSAREPTVVPWVLTAAGGGAALVGGAVAFVGALPWLGMTQENDRLRQIRAGFSDPNADQGALLQESIEARARADAQRGAWNDFGQWLWIGGAAGAGIGLATAGAGAVWLVASPSDSE